MVPKRLIASIRLLSLIAALLTSAAIALGRAKPASAPQRIPSPPSYQVLDQAVTALHGRGSFAIDRESGRLEKFPLPPGVGIDKASVSPWEEDGQRQIVGLGWNRSGEEESLASAEFGLIRMTLPNGEILNRLILSNDSLPVAAPCWIPNAPASVLYVGGDYRLYRVDFASPSDDRGEAAADVRPRPVEWEACLPGDGSVHVRDLTLPDDARLGGRALASLRFKNSETGRYTDWQLWWLRMDRGGASIVAAGRLLDPGPSDTAGSRRLPNVVSIGGEAALAYLAQRPGESSGRLRVAPIRFDADSGSPHALEGESRSMAEDCTTTSLVASPDCRWITLFRSGGGARLNAERVAVPNGDTPDLAGSDHTPAPLALKGVDHGRVNPPRPLRPVASLSNPAS